MPPGSGKVYPHFLRKDLGQFVPIEGTTLDSDLLDPADFSGAFVGAVQYIYDEALDTFVRVRANRSDAILLTSAARTVTTNSTSQENRNWRGLHVTIDVTAFAGTGIIPHIQNLGSNTFYDVLVGNTIVATGLIVIKVYPGIGVIAGGSASDILTKDWRFQMEHTDASSVTYQVDAQLVI